MPNSAAAAATAASTDSARLEVYRPGPFAVRDRLLLYLTGVVTDNVTGLELAAECLRRAGAGADYAAAMDALEQLLAERGILPSGKRLASFPPFNRRPMVSRKMGTHSVVSGMARLFGRVLASGSSARPGAPAGREGS